MHNVTTVELARDCEVVQIPHGTAVVLPKGTTADITQTLGGSYTIHAQGALFRVASKDADALGLETSAVDGPTPTAGSSGEVTEKQIWDTLRTCYDPEIPVNIVDLGLVYDMHVDRRPNGGSAVVVKMTLTAPGCGMGGILQAEAREKILALPGVKECAVDVVFDPPWTQSMMSEAARLQLGLM